jgi:hypothetical protein
VVLEFVIKPNSPCLVWQNISEAKQHFYQTKQLLSNQHLLGLAKYLRSKTTLLPNQAAAQ